MKIEKDCVVQFSYKLSDCSEKVIEESEDKVPMAYLHGHDGILKGLESELEGKAVGDKLKVVLQPEDAYGEVKADAEQRIPIKHLMGAKKWKKGMIATVQLEQGRQQVTLVKVGKFMVTVDFNHPFAGKVLTFDIEIADVRAATSEELAHGHAHGAGGHHH